MEKNIEKLFYPKNICIVGASSKPLSIGYELTKTILNYEYTGNIFIVNPKSDEILGVKCYPSISSINQDIDMAVLLVPKVLVEETITQVLAKNIKSIVLITAGFKETGAEGEELENRVLAMIKSSGARMVGPNCMGLINSLASTKLNATFVAERPEEGTSAFLSQSGALGAAVLNSLRSSGIKFAHFISVGNKADLNENDLLKYWEDDDNIKITSMYLESFSNGKEFLNLFLENKIKKPVIILKAGRSEEGMKAASSHTGALGSSDKAVTAILNQFNIIRADDLNEMFNTVKGFENFNLPKGNRVAVVTNAGGPAILAVDSIAKNGLTLSVLSPETKSALKEIVHPEGSINNPVDLLPGGNAEGYFKTTQILLSDANVDAVISIFVEPVMVQPMSVVEGINSIVSEKPVMQVVMPLPEFWDNYKNNSKFNKPLFKNPEDPAAVLANLLFYAKAENKKRIKPVVKEDVLLGKSGFLPVNEIKNLVSGYNLPVIEELFLSPENLKNYSGQFPIVIKGINKEVVHKTEMNAVKLNIKNINELHSAMDEISNSFASKNFTVEEYLVQPFVVARYELLIGGYRDNNFGPMIMFGTGGKYVEYIDDVVLKSAFLSDDDVDDMINKSKIGKIIQGVRGEKSVNINELKNIIKSAAQLMIDYPSIKEMDINPLIASSDNKFYAVDLRIKV